MVDFYGFMKLIQKKKTKGGGCGKQTKFTMNIDFRLLMGNKLKLNCDLTDNITDPPQSLKSSSSSSADWVRAAEMYASVGGYEIIDMCGAGQ